MAQFTISHIRTQAFEGGYANNKLDKGGETYKGIARKFWPNWEGWALVDFYKKKYIEFPNLELVLQANKGLQEMVLQFYQKNFFDEMMLWDVDQEVADELYDSAVNQGVGEASRAFQRSLNLLNRNQKDYADIKVDGSVGMKTLNAYHAYMSLSRFASRNEQKLKKWLIRWIDYYQMKKYEKAYGTDQEIWIPGWTDRV